MAIGTSLIREAYKMMRWRFIPVRYFGKLRALARLEPLAVARHAQDDQLAESGFDQGPLLNPEDVARIRAIYDPREATVAVRKGGHPFTNLFTRDDVHPDNPVFRFALSPQVLDRAHEYFSGRVRFDSIQYLYSWPTEGELQESQMWHRDFNDHRAFHCVAYLNDVLELADGPFAFVSKQDSRRIGRSPFIRRISDAQFARELGDGEIRVMYGRAGQSILIDPAACYHYGSRCRRPRRAIFATFSTTSPYVDAQAMIRGHEDAFLAASRVVRPDLSDAYLRQLAGL